MPTLTLKRIATFIFIITGLILPAACVPITPSAPTSQADAPTATPSISLLPTQTPLPSPTLPKLEVTSFPTQSCTEQNGSLQNDVLNDSSLPKPMRYIIYLPPCYAQSEIRYPVLYLLHGLSYTEDQWVRLGIAESADKLIAGGDIIPFIIVLPYNYGLAQPASDPFDDVLLDSLIPHIDTDYRTIARRETRAVGGLSRGGGWALHLGIRQYETFSIVGAHAPAIFYTDNASLKTRLQQIPADMHPNIYLDIGDADQQLKDAQRFAALLDELNFNHEWHLNIGAHTEDYWHAHIEDYLRWYSDQFSDN